MKTQKDIFRIKRNSEEEAEEFYSKAAKLKRRDRYDFSPVFAVLRFFSSSPANRKSDVKNNFIEKRLNALLPLKIYAERALPLLAYFILNWLFV